MEEIIPFEVKLIHPQTAIVWPWFSCDLGYLTVSFRPRIEMDENGPHVVCMDVVVEALIIKDEDRLRLYAAYEKHHYVMETFFSVVVLGNFDFPYPKSVFNEMLLLDLTENERQTVNKHISGFTCLYLIRDEDTGLTKIGRSNTPERRLKALIKQDTLMPKPNNFSIIRAWEDYPYMEKVLHKRFNHKRIRGEWFDLTDGDVKEALAHAYIYD